MSVEGRNTNEELLKLYAFATPDYVKTNDIINYQIVGENTSTNIVKNIVLSVSIPKEIAIINNSFTGSGVNLGTGSNLSIYIDSIQGGVKATVNFRAKVNDVDSSGYINTSVSAGYVYLQNDNLKEEAVLNTYSNVISTSIREAIINNIDGGLFYIESDKEYVKLNDIITYSISIKNTGNVPANNVIFRNFLPDGISFVKNSLVVNKIDNLDIGLNQNIAINLGNIESEESADILYKVQVVEIPKDYVINNKASVEFNYTINPLIQNGDRGFGESNISSIRFNEAIINIEEKVNKEYLQLNDEVTYKFDLINKGSLGAQNIIFLNTLPNFIDFIENSVVINNSALVGANPESGIKVQNLKSLEEASITFKATVSSLPDNSQNLLYNIAKLDYEYKLNTDTTITCGTYSTLTKRYINQAAIDNNFENSFDLYTRPIANIFEDYKCKIYINNIGNVKATQLYVYPSIPKEFIFKENSLFINNITIPNSSPQKGIYIQSLEKSLEKSLFISYTLIPIETVTIPLDLTATISYNYNNSPSTILSGSGKSNINKVIISGAVINNEYKNSFVVNSQKNVGGNQTYSFKAEVCNMGNMEATKITLMASIPNSVIYKENTFKLNGNSYNYNVDLSKGVLLPNINVGEKLKIEFDAIASGFPSKLGEISSSLKINYNYVLSNENQIKINRDGYSNTITTEINEAYINNYNDSSFVNSSKRKYFKKGDIVEYIFDIENIGNVSAENIIFKDKLQSGLIFIDGSFVNNGVNIYDGEIEESGIYISNINPNEKAKLSFKAQIDTIPSNNKISNFAKVFYNYKPGEECEYVDFVGSSNSLEIIVNNAFIDNIDNGFIQKVNKEFADVNEVISYEFSIKNTGNITATNIIFIDKIPEDTSIVEGTLIIGDEIFKLKDFDLSEGISICDIEVGESVIISFDLLVNRLPESNFIENVAYVRYNFLTNPNEYILECAEGKSNKSKVEIKTAVIDNSNGEGFTIFTPEYVPLNKDFNCIVNLVNTGNIEAKEVILKIILPPEVEFIEDSVVIDGVGYKGVNPIDGVNIEGIIPRGEPINVTFKVAAVNIKRINRIELLGYIEFLYNVNPDGYRKFKGHGYSNKSVSKINGALIKGEFLGSTKYADLHEVVKYKLVLTNVGNIDAVVKAINIEDDRKAQILDFKINNNYLEQSSFTIKSLEQKVITFCTDLKETNRLSCVEGAYKLTCVFDYSYIYDPNTDLEVEVVDNRYSYEVNYDYAYIEGGDFYQSSRVNDKVESNINYTDVNSEINYLFSIINRGNVDADEVVFKNPIIDELSYVEDSVLLDNKTIGSKFNNNILELYLGKIEPKKVKNLTWKVKVNSIPSPNVVVNKGFIEYKYTVNPYIINGRERHAVSNEVKTTINEAIIDFNRGGGLIKKQSKDSLNLGEELTYTIEIKNTGNIDAIDVVLIDNNLDGIEFVEDSVIVNGEGTKYNLQNISLGTLKPGVINIVSYRVMTSKDIKDYPIESKAMVKYGYLINPYTDLEEDQIPKYAKGYSNKITCDTNRAIIDFNRGNGFIASSEPSYLDYHNKMEYKIFIKNTGNINANNVVLTDSIPEGFSFIENSVIIDGTPYIGSSPEYGIKLGIIKPLESRDISFKVIPIKDYKRSSEIKNKAMVKYTFTADPDMPNGIIERGYSNDAISYLNYASMGEKKFKGRIDDTEIVKYCRIGDIIKYSYIFYNSGTTIAKDVIFHGYISNEEIVSPIKGSISINGVLVPTAEPNNILLGDILPDDVTVITYQAKINKITYKNDETITAYGSCDYNYISNLDNNELVKSYGKSNDCGVIVREAIINFNDKESFTLRLDKDYYSYNDILTYSAELKNIGNIQAKNVYFYETLPNNIEFLNNSVIINGVNLRFATVTYPDGINLGNLNPNEVTTIEYKIKILNNFKLQEVKSIADTKFTYIKDPKLGVLEEVCGSSNEVKCIIRNANFNAESGGLIGSCEKDIVRVNEEIGYEFVLKNQGNVDAENVIFTIDNNDQLEIIDNSVFINDENIKDINLIDGAFLDRVEVGDVFTINFKVKVTILPELNKVKCQGKVYYKYTLNDEKNIIIENTEVSNLVVSNVKSADISVESGGIELGINKDIVTIGDIVEYNIKLKNTGNCKASNVELFYKLPEGTKIVEDDIQVNGNIGVIGENNKLIIGTIIPGEAMNIKSKLLVDTLPQNNRVYTGCRIEYNYSEEDTLEKITNESNDVEINILRNGMDGVKYVERSIVDVGDNIEYTIVLKNVGNVKNERVVVQDITPEGTRFVENSFSLNGVIIPGINISQPYNIGDIDIESSSTINFKVEVLNNNINKIKSNQLITKYCYRNPLDDISNEAEITTNTVETEIRHAEISSKDGGVYTSVDKNKATVNDIIIYTVALNNTGNIEANNVVYTDYLEKSLELVEDSVLIDGKAQRVNPSRGIVIGTLGANDIKTISFKVKILEGFKEESISTQGIVSYEYKVDEDDEAKSVINLSNPIKIDFLYVDFKINIAANKNPVFLDDDVTFVIKIKNDGNINGENIILRDELLGYFRFIEKSVMVDNKSYIDSDINKGITFNIIEAKKEVVVTFKAKIIALPPAGISKNKATLDYEYRLKEDGIAGIGHVDSLVISVIVVLPVCKIKEIPIIMIDEKLLPSDKENGLEIYNPYCGNKTNRRQYTTGGICTPQELIDAGEYIRKYRMWSQNSISEKFKVDTSDIQNIQCIKAEIKIINTSRVIGASSNSKGNFEGKILTGVKQGIISVIEYTITYISMDGKEKIITLEHIFANNVIVSEVYMNEELNISTCIEDISIGAIENNLIHINTIAMYYLTPSNRGIGNKYTQNNYIGIFKSNFEPNIRRFLYNSGKTWNYFNYSLLEECGLDIEQIFSITLDVKDINLEIIDNPLAIPKPKGEEYDEGNDKIYKKVNVYLKIRLIISYLDSKTAVISKATGELNCASFLIVNEDKIVNNEVEIATAIESAYICKYKDKIYANVNTIIKLKE